MHLATILVLLAARSQAAEAPCVSTTGRTVAINGSATVRLPPDRVAFTVGVETVDADVAKAFEANDKKLRAVVASLKAKGVASKDIQTSNLDISSRDERGQRFSGFRVTNLVTVTSAEPARAGELLQAAVATGANQAGGLRFFVADTPQARTRGLELAFEDARGKAQTLAQQAKRSLGDVVCVSESPSWAAGATNNTVAFYADSSSGTEAGAERVSFSLSVVFELK
jgi:uncharacterized protein YggE